MNADFVEAVFAENLSNNKKVTVGSVYRPQITNFDAFIKFIEIELQPMTSNSADLYVCGHFNVDVFN